MALSAETAARLEILDGTSPCSPSTSPAAGPTRSARPCSANWKRCVQDLAGRTDLTGLILCSGKPGMFIAGADLKELGGARPDPETARRLVQRGLDLVAAVEELPFPTVAAIDGACMGGGTELALGFDYRLAGSHPKTEIGLPETKIGLIPGWGGTQRLTRLIGPSLAAEMICAGEPAKAERARQLGIVFDAVPRRPLAGRGPPTVAVDKSDRRLA